MENLLAITYPVLFAGGIIAALIVLLVLEIYNSKRVSKLTYPVYEFALKRAEDEAARIITEARAQARQLIEKAEEESLSVVGSHKAQDQAAEDAYQKGLQALESNLQNELQTRAAAAEEAEQKLSAAFESELHQAGEQSRTELAHAFDTLEKENATRIDERVAEAFAVAKRDAEAYERARKEAVDAHISALISETMKLVLQKNLPVEVHADLVRSALEEAKANRVF